MLKVVPADLLFWARVPGRLCHPQIDIPPESEAIIDKFVSNGGVLEISKARGGGFNLELVLDRDRLAVRTATVSRTSVASSLDACLKEADTAIDTTINKRPR